MAGDRDGLAAAAGKLDDDVLHGDGADGSLRGEIILADLRAGDFDVVEDVGLKLVIRRAAGGARAERDGGFGGVESGGYGEISGGGRMGQAQNGEEGDQEGFRAEHI